MGRYSLSDVINLYRSSKSKYERRVYFSYFFLRPISYLPSVVLANLGLSANSTTWIGFVFGLFSLVLFAVAGPSYAVIAWMCYFIFLIFDHIDGNIARLQGRTTYYGKFIDSITEKIIDALLDFSIAVGLTFKVTGAPNALFLVGALSSLVYLTAVIIDCRFHQLLYEYYIAQGVLADNPNKNQSHYQKKYTKDKYKMLIFPYTICRFIDINCRPALLFVTSITGTLSIYLFLSLFLHIVQFAAVFFQRVVVDRSRLLFHRDF